MVKGRKINKKCERNKGEKTEFIFKFFSIADDSLLGYCAV
jgi:hypothetical protein